ncbi:hypothetical protein N7449_005106, partial [Penicillium cf. viridicatum]
TVISLYKQIRANTNCLIDYKVKYNSSRQFFLSAIDSSPNQGHISVDTYNQSFPNDFDKHLPNGLNINSPSNSDITSYDSAIDLNDNYQYTSTRAGSLKTLERDAYSFGQPNESNNRATREVNTNNTRGN